MEFQDVVGRRRMVRNFDDRPVPALVVDRLLANAMRAPSAGNTQGWGFLVLEGPADTGRFWSASFPDAERTGFAHPGLFRAPLLIAVFSCPDAYAARYREPDKAGSRATASPWPVPYWHVDAGFAALLVLLSAVDAGLGALFFRVFRPEAVKAAFSVPDGHLAVGAIAVGYPRPDRPSPSLARGRRPVEEVVHRGRWAGAT